MTKKQRKKNEEELRKQIQEKLERKFKEKQQRSKPGRNKAEQEIPVQEVRENLEEKALRQRLEDELCSQYPEFVKCENHLGEVKWLTLFELANDYEFMPVEESRWQRWKNRFFKSSSAEKETSPEEARLRKEVRQDIEKRLQIYKKHLSDKEDEQMHELEKKIHEEEVDRFYRNKRGYKKYINHLGETKWLNQEEYANQDEFIEEVESPSKIWLRRVFYAGVVLVLAALIWLVYDLQYKDGHERSYLVVYTSESKGLLYIDKNLAVSFDPGKPYPINAGEHEISMFSSGYTAIPKTHHIKVSKGDTARISFAFMKRQDTESGLVQIISPVSSAEILLDGEFQGTLDRQDKIMVSPGNHTLSLQKSGYICKPRQRIFKIEAGDTLRLDFSMNPVKNLKSRKIYEQVINMGLIEVRSNIKNADIYLDGQKTDFQTDYVLQGVPFGQHIISVRKKDHKVYPEERVIRLSKSNKRSSVDFTLSSTVRRISITTTPVEGMIYVDGKAVGQGAAKIPLPIGEHKISFGEIAHYQKPSATSFTVTDNSPDRLIFQYLINFGVRFSPGGINPETQSGSVNSGYLLGDERLRNSQQAGPEIKKSADGKFSYWYMGYAFPYRNPPGRDALEFNFYIPENVDLSQPLYLKVWAYETKDFYPLVIKGNSMYRIDINQIKFRKEVKPRFSFAKMGEENFDQFRINDQLHPGYNRILIATTKSASAHLALWKIAVE